MRRGEFITLVVLSGEEKKPRAAGCDDFVPNHSAHANYWRKFASTCPKPGINCCTA